MSTCHPNAQTSWESAAIVVELRFMGDYGLQGDSCGIDEKNLDGKNGGSLRFAEPQINKQSGRYRQKVTVPI
ncbi:MULTISPECIES: hypothetical protein [Cyanophyceae]|uniref:hypothetical protein n=1 Tax=Cyanophyceae TaxID=3028117 RepID=UPI0016837389|nr:hypothetical protein [Trichocoleus sp. FACHB-40]MBD2006368.1 hypothetical protein [Trichocoleus sp. FACHB-40]